MSGPAPTDPATGPATDAAAGAAAVGPDRRHRWISGGAVALVLGAIVVVWALGGFERQTRPFEAVAPGAVITAGPFELVFTELTVQQVAATSFDKAGWKVLVKGTGRTTGEESITPSVYGDGGMFVMKDLGTNAIRTPTGQTIGDGGAGSFTPGLPAVPYVVEFRFDDSEYAPGSVLRLGVIDQRYTDTSLVQSGEAQNSWRNGNRGFQLDLPITRVPPER